MIQFTPAEFAEINSGVQSLTVTKLISAAFYSYILHQNHRAAEILEEIRRERSECTCALWSYFGGGVNCPKHGVIR